MLQRHSSTLLGARRTLGMTLVELMIVVAIIGVLAAIAIPSFQKTIRRSRTTEALIALRRIYDGAVAYYGFPHMSSSGVVLPEQFPASVSLTPAQIPRGRKAEPNPEDWTQPTWQALTFAVADPHYYCYLFESHNVSARSRFRGAAFGDLDGDEIYSTFVRGGTVRGGEIRGYAGIYRMRELE
ncbi:MAG: prepilin-type N-terminal cleavage/methylation domain-containing protein [Bradymonadales bacterium]|nr:prepilin-type N-terminal cleavage/methylation domain-containing protein [Bradymonadales bacterium]